MSVKIGWERAARTKSEPKVRHKCESCGHVGKADVSARKQKRCELCGSRNLTKFVRGGLDL